MQGLERHLAGDDLLTLLVRINAEQQAYVRPARLRGLLRRHLRGWLSGRAPAARAARGVGADEHALRRTVRPCPAAVHACRAGVAHAGSATARQLHPRVLARRSPHRHWRQRVVWHHLVGAALLFVGSDGPDPAAALRVRGWRVVAVTPRLIQSQLHLPSPLWGVIGRPWRAAPFLLLPPPSQPAESRFAA